MNLMLCGSTRFYPKIEAAAQVLAGFGHCTKIPELLSELPPELKGNKQADIGLYIASHGGLDYFPPDHPLWKVKQDAIRDNFQKIRWSDGIVVINYEAHGIEGYIGGNTLMEIAVAFYLQKRLFIMHPISSELSYKHEIMATRPVLLDGDLALVS